MLARNVKLVLHSSQKTVRCPHSPTWSFQSALFHTSGGAARSPSNTEARQKTISVEESFELLGVDSECTDNELRSAYLEKVKENHPDRNKSVEGSNAAKFVEIQNAYKVATDYKRGKAFLEEEEKKQVDIHDIKHTVPQHRRYLTFDGVGFGTPSKRERQYKQVRVAQAAESIFEHRKLKFGHEENALVTKDKTEARKIKISNLIDRVVDDLIRESIKRGDFDNLSGKGKPLDHSDHNPFIDTTTHNINKIMVNNGFKPEWIMLSKEIRDNFATAREKLAIIREKLGKSPPFEDESSRMMWDFHCDRFRQDIQEVNQKINKFNFIVPFMEKQMVHFNVERNIEKIIQNHKDFLPVDGQGKPLTVEELGHFPPQVYAEDVKIKWGEVWANIKEVFNTRPS